MTNPAEFTGQTFRAQADRTHHFVEIICHYVDPKQPLRILDIGCGTGTLLFELLKILPLAAGTGVDLSEANIQVANDYCQQIGWEGRLTFVVNDYLEFQVEPVDLIVTYSTLQNIPASAEQLFVKIAADLKNHETCYIIAGVKKKKIIMDKIIPLKSLTGLLKLPEAGLLRLDFLLTEEADGVYIRCLDFGIMSRGNTVNECQENIIEAMMIYLEDLPDGQSLFNPAPPQYWQMFYELRYHQERTIVKQLSHQAKQAIVNLPVVFQYA